MTHMIIFGPLIPDPCIKMQKKEDLACNSGHLENPSARYCRHPKNNVSSHKNAEK